MQKTIDYLATALAIFIIISITEVFIIIDEKTNVNYYKSEYNNINKELVDTIEYYNSSIIKTTNYYEQRLEFKDKIIDRQDQLLTEYRKFFHDFIRKPLN